MSNFLQYTFYVFLGIKCVHIVFKLKEIYNYEHGFSPTVIVIKLIEVGKQRLEP
jgi:hypothetical protein